MVKTSLPPRLTGQDIDLLGKVLGRDKLRFVGGCVRDSLLERPFNDIDFCTPHLPETMMAKLKNAGIKVVPTGLKHGTITAVFDTRQFEITTLRRDVETDGRHAKVDFTHDWLEDAKRRDFTFNAMMLTLEGDLFDPFGGFEDLQSGRVRFVGDAGERVAEDYLRLLRFFRFFAQFGQQEPDENTIIALTEAGPKLHLLSGERLWQETSKLLVAPDEGLMVALSLMEQCEILPHLLVTPNAHALRRLLDLEENVGKKDLLLRLATFEGGCPGAIEKTITRFRLSNSEKDILLSASRTPSGKLDYDLHFDGRETVQRRLLLQAAVQAEVIDETAWKQSQTWRNVPFPLQGADLLQAGFIPGPQVGELLRKTELWWLDLDRKPDKAACLEFALKR